MKCQCKPECDLDAPTVVHVVDQGATPGSATVRPVALAHLYNLQREAADAAGADKGPRKPKSG